MRRVDHRRSRAAHLWVRETDPLAAPGLVAKPLQSLTEKRMTSAKEKLGFEELVARLRKGPTTFSVFALPGLDAAANGIEYFVHHEDVRRAQATPPPRGSSPTPTRTRCGSVSG